MNITALESSILALLVAESDSNGHDFGLLENVEWADRRQLGAIVTTLQSKGVIVDVSRTDVIDGQRWTQYVLADAFKVEG